ncbi:MAG: hypothetical protein LBU60_02865 [Clostridiales bacterium]|jgi:hypothetical protein|nr:hypothetical protein [Clostridiales bacterium]
MKSKKEVFVVFGLSIIFTTIYVVLLFIGRDELQIDNIGTITLYTFVSIWLFFSIPSYVWVIKKVAAGKSTYLDNPIHYTGGSSIMDNLLMIIFIPFFLAPVFGIMYYVKKIK